MSGGLLLLTFSGIIARYVFNSAFTWELEVSYLLHIYVICFAAYLGMEDRSHISIGWFRRRIAPRVMDFIGKGMSLAFLTFMVCASLPLLGHVGSSTIRLGIPYPVYYFALTLMLLLLVVELVRTRHKPL